MPWNVGFKSTNLATINSVSGSSVDVPFMAWHTDGRTDSKIVSRNDWDQTIGAYEAKMYLAALLAKDAAIAKATPNLITINAYIATNPVLATG